MENDLQINSQNMAEEQLSILHVFGSRLSSFPVTICYSPTKGRYVKCNRNIAAGEQVFQVSASDIIWISS
jgi:hypothetical protein